MNEEVVLPGQVLDQGRALFQPPVVEGEHAIAPVEEDLHHRLARAAEALDHEHAMDADLAARRNNALSRTHQGVDAGRIALRRRKPALPHARDDNGCASAAEHAAQIHGRDHPPARRMQEDDAPRLRVESLLAHEGGEHAGEAQRFVINVLVAFTPAGERKFAEVFQL